MTQNVNDGDVRREIWFALGVALRARLAYLVAPLTVTSMVDGQHKKGSLHYLGAAVDLRTSDLSPDAARFWASEVMITLDPFGFDVILESDHLHIEFDPKDEQHFIRREE